MIMKNTKVNWTVKDIVLNLEFIRTQDESPHEGILIIHDQPCLHFSNIMRYVMVALGFHTEKIQQE